MSTNSSEGRGNFGLLPEPERSPASFITSAVVNLLIAILVVFISLAARKVIQQPKVERTELLFPTTPPPPPHIKIVPPKLPPPPKPQVKLELPKIQPKPEPKPLPEIKPEPKPVPVIAAAKPQVVLKPQPKTALAVAAAPALQPQPHPDTHPVHFGDLNGVTPNPNANKPATVAAIGNPSGGNSGPAAAPRGVVGSAGFGNGTQSGSNAGAAGRVASAGIPGGNGTAGHGGTGNGNARVGSAGLASAASHPASAMPAAAAEAKVTNPDVTYSPRPAYTEEAKRLGIQGDVVLHVRLTASGQVVVLGVVRGLGHGLDELAQRAAQSIRFRPAMRNGQPVDFTTNISISFQLA